MEKLKSVLTVLWSIFVFCSVVYFRYHRIKRASKRRTRENLLIGGFMLVLAAVIIACYFHWRDWYYEPAPTPYATMDEAEADGCIVINSPHFLERGRERWEQFYGMTNFGIPDTIRIAVWDGGEAQVVNTILFDGEQYHYTSSNGLKHSDSTTNSYPYLLYLRHDPDESENTMYHWKESYILTDKADLTAKEFASRWQNDAPSFRYVEVIADYAWKDAP